jgi:hypothetical protein
MMQHRLFGKEKKMAKKAIALFSMVCVVACWGLKVTKTRMSRKQTENRT